MVSTVHEALRDLVRDDPMLCADLLAGIAMIDRRSIDGASCVDPTVPQNVSPALSADAVVVLRSAASPVLVVVVEVQLEVDDEKQWSWPLYAASLRREHGCPTAVLAICPREGVANWARTKLVLGPSHSFAPIVLSRAEIPAIEDRTRARERPALAVLAAIAHGNDRAVGLSVVFAALSAVNSLEEARARVYTSAIWDTLDRVAQRALEVAMSEQTPPVETNFERRMRELFEDKWRRESEAKGRAEGEARGRAEGEADALRTVLAARGFVLDAATEARIASCQDLQILRAWIARAVSAATLEAVFAE
jgi:hypothetical protein